MAEERKMSYPYLRNVVGMKVDDESMKSVPHAKGELYYHVSVKFAQMFAIFGGLIGLGYGAFKKRSLLTSAMNGSRNGMLLGVPVGIATTYGQMKAINKDPDCDVEYQFYDRSYRLRHNRNQVRVDRMSYVGEAVGVVAAAATGSSVLGGAALGLAAGTIFGGLTNKACYSKTKKE